MYKVIVRLEYKTSVADKCVFVHIDTSSYLIIIAIYTSDFLFISKFLKFIKFFKSEISRYFIIKDLDLAK